MRIIVIGSGLGGLAAALRARAAGHDVLVLERGTAPGGRARVLQAGAWRIDAGPTVVTAPFLFAELFALFGEVLAEHVELLPVTPFYRVLFADGRRFDLTGDPKAMQAEVASFAAGDVAGYRRLLRRSAALYRVGFERYGARSFHSWTTMLRVLPALLRLGGHRSVFALVRRHLRSPHLRRVFSLQPLLVGGHPFHTSGVYALITHLERAHGVWFPRGGMEKLVGALAELLERQGGEIRLGTDVVRLRTTGRRVTGVALASGEVLAADAVISNADAASLYADLLPAAQRRRRWTARRLDRLTYSMGLFVLCFATRRRYDDVAHHTILLGHRYKRLLDEIFGTGSAVPDDLSLYLHRPAATDPAIAPAGHDIFYVLAPVPNLRAPIAWETAAPRLRDRLVAMLAERALPGLDGDIVAERWMTPRDFAADYRSRHGAGFSIAPLLTQSAWFRFHNRSEEIDGLYLVGAGTHPGAGLPGVLTSAKVVEGLLAKKARGAAPGPRWGLDPRPHLSKRVGSKGDCP